MMYNNKNINNKPKYKMMLNSKKIVILLGTTIFLKEYVGILLIKNIEIIKSDVENDLLYVKGSIPGSKNTRVLVRKSGTESKIRLMAESDNKILLSRCVNMISKKIR